MKEACPHCESRKTKKNGTTHYGKQNHRCNTCGRQFVIGGQDWFISTERKALIDKLLLERLSLSGIVRVTGVSCQWLQLYIKEKYGSLPDDLNADLSLPNQENYLDNKFDKEIVRLKKKAPKPVKLTLKQ